MLNRFKGLWTRFGEHAVTPDEMKKAAAIVSITGNILPWAAFALGFYLLFKVGMAFLPGGAAWIGR